MPKSILSTNVSWGRLRCIGAEFELRTTGNATDGFRQRNILRYTLQCACNKTVKVWSMDFPGKRLMRDCGCGISGKDYEYIDTKLRLPLDTVQFAREFMGGRGMTLSYAVSELLRLGWEKYLEVREDHGVEK